MEKKLLLNIQMFSVVPRVTQCPVLKVIIVVNIHFMFDGEIERQKLLSELCLWLVNVTPEYFTSGELEANCDWMNLSEEIFV